MVGRVDAKYFGSTEAMRPTGVNMEHIIRTTSALSNVEEDKQAAAGTVGGARGAVGEETAGTVLSDLSVWGPTGNVVVPVQWRVSHKGMGEAEAAELARELRSVKMNYREQLHNVLKQHK